MQKIWLFLGVALLGAMLALGAAACGDDDDDDNGGTTPDAPTATEAADATAAPGATEPDATEPADGEPGAFTTVVATENPTLGTILTTFDGYTLYTFDNDSAGTSTCGEGCVSTWTPFAGGVEPTAGDGVSGTLGTIERDDGTTQVTYNDMPLYMFSGDASPGDTNGDGVLEIWHVVSLD